MWLFNHQLLLLMSLLVVSCGFTPVYSPNSSFQNLNNHTQIQIPNDKDSFILVEELQTKLGNQGNKYSLTFDLTTKKNDILTSTIGRALRFNINGTVDFTLTALKNNKTIYQGQVTNFTSYSATGQTAETRFSEQEAHTRLMRILANQILTQLYARQELRP